MLEKMIPAILIVLVLKCSIDLRFYPIAFANKLAKIFPSLLAQKPSFTPKAEAGSEVYK